MAPFPLCPDSHFSGRVKQTKQQKNAGQSPTAKKAEQKAKRAAKKEGNGNAVFAAKK